MSLVTDVATKMPEVAVRARSVPLLTVWILALILVTATLFGLLDDGAYRETAAREYLGGTLRGQDVLTLLTVPLLVWTAYRSRAGSLRAHLVWLGLLLYVAYSYLMYVVVPYNDAFLLYVAAIGISFWLLLDGLLRVDVPRVAPAFARAPRRGIGWFLVVTGGLFAALWVTQNLLVLPGGIPEGLFVYDVPSTVHVLDLAFVLPLVVGTGVLLLRGAPAGPVLAAVVLVKMVTLGLALLFMNGGVAAAGGDINAAETAMWAAIVLISGTALVRGTGRLDPVPQKWRKPSVWV